MINHVDGETLAGVRATRQSVFPLHPPTSLSSNWLTRPIQFRRYDMADPKKQEKDFTKEVDSLIPEAQTIAKVRPNAQVVCGHY